MSNSTLELGLAEALRAVDFLSRLGGCPPETTVSECRAFTRCSDCRRAWALKKAKETR